MMTDPRLKDALPVLDSRGELIGWRAPPRCIGVKYTLVMVESARNHPDPGFHAGMLLRVHEIDGNGVVFFHVLHEGDPDAVP